MADDIEEYSLVEVGLYCFRNYCLSLEYQSELLFIFSSLYFTRNS